MVASGVKRVQESAEALISGVYNLPKPEEETSLHLNVKLNIVDEFDLEDLDKMQES